MTLDPTRCYRAVCSRDPRFDGRFFTGVVTTGIYCRPTCPARRPKPGSCRFFPSAAAAEESGFRACLRCRPEAAPGTPGWAGSAATVARALRLIESGDGASAGIEGLCARLGVGSRQLRRLFAEHLGASPIAVVRTRRTQFAKRLIDETRVPLGIVARSAGFGSVRRFNAVMHRAYGRPPRALRAPSGTDERPADGLLLRLPYRPPYAWESILAFLRTRAVAGVEIVTRAAYRRTFALGGACGTLEVRRAAADALALRIPTVGVLELHGLTARVRRLFDTAADPVEIDRHLATDRRLAAAVRVRPGLRVPGAFDPFELAVRAVLGQQVTLCAAATLASRIVRKFGERLSEPDDTGLDGIFPSPQRLAEAELEGLGLPGARAATIRHLARAVLAGELFARASGLDDAVERLLRIPGVGEWTAHYVAMRALGEPDAFPASDLGLRRAVGRDRVVSPAAVRRAGEAWRPWRSYAAMHLWTEGDSDSAEREVRDEGLDVDGEPGRSAAAHR